MAEAIWKVVWDWNGKPVPLTLVADTDTHKILFAVSPILEDNGFFRENNFVGQNIEAVFDRKECSRVWLEKVQKEHYKVDIPADRHLETQGDCLLRGNNKEEK